MILTKNYFGSYCKSEFSRSVSLCHSEIDTYIYSSSLSEIISYSSSLTSFYNYFSDSGAYSLSIDNFYSVIECKKDREYMIQDILE